MKNTFTKLSDGSYKMSFRYKKEIYYTLIDESTMLDLQELNITWIGQVGNHSNSTDIRVRGTISLSFRKRKSVLLHRWILNASEGMIVDHKNRDPLDNRISNLNLVTNAESAQNKGLYKRNKSGARGVHWYKNYQKWCVSLRLNGKKIHGGYFTNFAEAVYCSKFLQNKYFDYLTSLKEG